MHNNNNNKGQTKGEKCTKDMKKEERMDGLGGRWVIECGSENEWMKFLLGEMRCEIERGRVLSDSPRSASSLASLIGERVNEMKRQRPERERDSV